MKKFILLAALVFSSTFTSAARADWVKLDGTSTSPAAASTTFYPSSAGFVTEVGLFTSCSFTALVQGATGGTLDIYIQTFMAAQAGGKWTDAAHLTQLAAAAGLAKVAFTLTRFSPSTSAITASLNTVDGTPTLTANTVVPGLLGVKLRIVYVAGASTSAGASQVILATCSST